MGSQSLLIRQAGMSPASGTPFPFSYQIAGDTRGRGAAYSKALDRIVIVSTSPDELHLFDPVTHTERTLALPYTPIAVTLQADGLKAAVSHPGGAIVVNLQTLVLERSFELPQIDSEMVLPGNGYAYAFGWPSLSQDGFWLRPFHSIDLATGQVTISASPALAPARLHPSRNHLYSNALSSSLAPRMRFRKWDLQSGAAVEVALPEKESCGQFWLAEDGERLLNSCGHLFRTSDMTQIGAFEQLLLRGGFAIVGADHSAQRKQFAVVQHETSEIQLYSSETAGVIGRRYLAGSRGRNVFWRSDATKLYAISLTGSWHIPA